MFRTFTTAAILALTITAAQAGPSAIVRFSDLDPSRPADTQVLNGRIEKAAKTTCNTVKTSRTTSTTMFYNHWYAGCVNDTVAETSARIAAVSGKYRAIASK
jgi:UrcA family protein